MKKLICLVSAVYILAECVCTYGAEKPPVFENLTRGGRPVKIYLGEFLNDTGEKYVSPKDFNERFAKTLLSRHSIQFEITESSIQSAVAFSGRIEQFFYAIKDPIIDKTTFVSKLKDEPNFAEITVTYTAANPLTSEILFQDTIHTIVKRDMTREESVGYAFDKVVRTIVRTCFGSPRADKLITDTD